MLDAQIAIQEAIAVADTPIAHFLLARAALDDAQFASAYAELKQCIARRGEAANGIDDVTAYRYVPLFTYYLAKAQEGLGSAESATTYRAFLEMMHEPDQSDPYVADARKRVN